MQISCRQTSSERASTSGRTWQCSSALPARAAQSSIFLARHNKRSCQHSFLPNDYCSLTLHVGSFQSQTQQQRDRLICFCSPQHLNGSNNNSNNAKGPVIVIDNYDSFTYNICQVTLPCRCFWLLLLLVSECPPVLVACSILET